MGKITVVSPNDTEQLSSVKQGAKINLNVSSPVVSPEPGRPTTKGGGIGTSKPPINSPVPGK